MFNLEDLKTLNLTHPNVEELLMFNGIADMLHAQYEKLGVESPEWLDNCRRGIRHEVKARQADAVDKQIRELTARLETLKTTSERRAETEAKLEKLKALSGNA